MSDRDMKGSVTPSSLLAIGGDVYLRPVLGRREKNAREVDRLFSRDLETHGLQLFDRPFRISRRIDAHTTHVRVDLDTSWTYASHKVLSGADEPTNLLNDLVRVAAGRYAQQLVAVIGRLQYGLD